MSFIGKILGGITGTTAATKAATKAATYAADTNNALARDIFGQTSARLEPYSQSGLQAQGYYNALLGLPSSVDQETARGAFDNYLNTSGFNDEYEQGVRGIVGGQFARRMGGSGSTLKALERYRMGSKNAAFTNYLNSIGNQQAGGLSAATAQAGVGSNYTGQVSANNNSRASAVGNAALAGAASNTNFLSGLISSAAMLSDERAKTITAYLGDEDDGLPIFRYKYTGSEIEHVGPMAQDVALYRPWALGPRRADGMLTILPGMLEAA